MDCFCFASWRIERRTLNRKDIDIDEATAAEDHAPKQRRDTGDEVDLLWKLEMKWIFHVFTNFKQRDPTWMFFAFPPQGLDVEVNYVNRIGGYLYHGCDTDDVAIQLYKSHRRVSISMDVTPTI